MEHYLPEKTQSLIRQYLQIKVSGIEFPCPYYQNIAHKRGTSTYVGKGLPKDIEREAQKLFNTSNTLDIQSIRLYMVMAGLGIDCSGFVVRILDSLLQETYGTTIIHTLRTLNPTFLNTIRYYLRPYTNISANMLTSSKNTVKINNYNDLLPGDLLRFGTKHVAIIISVEKTNKLTRKISYAHSTSDYEDEYGVRVGFININRPELSLEKQEWKETYKNKNWTYLDYTNSPENDKGFRRLKFFVKN